MSSGKKSQESALKTLRDLASFQENRFCFDCNQRGPTYVNISIGSFICTGCGGALRKYNQRVKSISMSNFSSQELYFLKRRGNAACQKIYMASCGSVEPPEKSENFDDFLRLKYQVKKWYREPGPEVEETALRENQDALDRASQASEKKVTKIGANSAAGLIILPNRSLPSLSASSVVNQTSPIVSNGFSKNSNLRTTSDMPRHFHSTQLTPTQNNAQDTSNAADMFSGLITARPQQSFVTVFDQAPITTFGVTFQDSVVASVMPAGTTTTTVTSQLAPQPYSWPNMTSVQPDAFAQPQASQPRMMSQTLLPASSTPFFAPPPMPMYTATSVDKYAALAELDGMRKSSSDPSATSTSTVTAAASTTNGSGLPTTLPAYPAPMISIGNPFGPSPSSFPVPLNKQSPMLSSPLVVNANPFGTPAYYQIPPATHNPFLQTAAVGGVGFNPFVGSTSFCSPTSVFPSAPTYTSSGQAASSLNPFVNAR